jgi:predicted KAP-like P-loop ATPase
MDRLAGLLAHSKQVNGNPRIVKRLLNVVRMRVSVARRRGMALDESIIAKLALFERCTDESAIRALNALISAAPTGKAPTFVELESVDKAITTENLPKEWQKYPDFILDWLKLDPPLGGIDLRPAVYLSKETMPVKLSPQRISGKTLHAIEVLLKTISLKSAASKAALDSIDGSETGDAMDEMIAIMKRNPDWSRIRSDFRGAYLLAKHDQSAHEKLVSFIGTLPGKRPRWLVTMMKDDPTEISGSNS